MCVVDSIYNYQFGQDYSGKDRLNGRRAPWIDEPDAAGGITGSRSGL